MNENSKLVDSQSPDGRYRLLIEAIADYAIYMLDAEGHVTSWNPGAKRFKGYEAEEIVGQHFRQFYTPEDRAIGKPERALETAKTEGRFEAEGWRVRKDGTRFWAHVIIDPVRNPDGTIVGFAKITRDITERRDSQLALEHAREQLLQAQKMEAIGQLTGGVAHDFNNLLTAIISSLELLRKRVPDDPMITRLLDNAMQGAQRGATLTQRMLSFARRQPLDMEPVDVHRVVDNLAEFLRPSLGPEVHIVVDIPEGLPPALTDSNQLETAMVNLCLNARDAMPGGGRITIGARTATGSAPSEGPYLVITVRDEGEGMDAATLSKATEPFFTTKGVGKGSGLGLPMVHGLAAQSGGRLTLSSTPGKGTSAELWLPVASGVPPTESVVATTQQETADKLAVLVVDDDALVLMNTVMMLEDAGHKVTEAYSGSEALRALSEKGPFDLVISDHAMPGMTGSELARQIDESWPGLPVILATGYAELPSGEQHSRPLLAKPFSEMQLRDAVAQAVAR